MFDRTHHPGPFDDDQDDGQDDDQAPAEVPDHPDPRIGAPVEPSPLDDASAPDGAGLADLDAYLIHG